MNADAGEAPEGASRRGGAEGSSSAGDGTYRTPRWVKLFGIVAAVVVLLLVAVLAFGGSEHGPGRHDRSGDDGNATSHEEGNHTRPPDHHPPAPAADDERVP